jgi:hypothetical protein
MIVMNPDDPDLNSPEYDEDEWDWEEDSYTEEELDLAA